MWRSGSGWSCCALAVVLFSLMETGRASAQARGKRDPEIANLIKESRVRDDARRGKAIERLRELAEEGKPVVERLCEFALDRNEKARASALETLSHLEPELAEGLRALAIPIAPAGATEFERVRSFDKQLEGYAAALKSLSQLGTKAAPAAPLAARALSECLNPKANLGSSRALTDTVQGSIAVLEISAPTNAAALKILLRTAQARPIRRHAEVYATRGALTALGRLAKSHPELREQLVLVLAAALSDTQIYTVLTDSLAEIAAAALADLGVDARPALPKLKQLAASADERHRNAAQRALERIP